MRVKRGDLADEDLVAARRGRRARRHHGRQGGAGRHPVPADQEDVADARALAHVAGRTDVAGKDRSACSFGSSRAGRPTHPGSAGIWAAGSDSSPPTPTAGSGPPRGSPKTAGASPWSASPRRSRRDATAIGPSSASGGGTPPSTLLGSSSTTPQRSIPTGMVAQIK